MKKLLTQKLGQLKDKFPSRSDIKEDYLTLKLSQDDKLVLTFQKKYKDEI